MSLCKEGAEVLSEGCHHSQVSVVLVLFAFLKTILYTQIFQKKLLRVGGFQKSEAERAMFLCAEKEGGVKRIKEEDWENKWRT